MTGSHIPSYGALVAAYSKDPEKSLHRLANSLTSKWGPADVDREDASHADEYSRTGEDKNLIDRYIISQIGQARADAGKARIRELLLRQVRMRRAWEKLHPGEDINTYLPKRMARFRQYRDIPFPV